VRDGVLEALMRTFEASRADRRSAALSNTTWNASNQSEVFAAGAEYDGGAEIKLFEEGSSAWFSFAGASGTMVPSTPHCPACHMAGLAVALAKASSRVGTRRRYSR
jgi:hypothetical protein